MLVTPEEKYIHELLGLNKHLLITTLSQLCKLRFFREILYNFHHWGTSNDDIYVTHSQSVDGRAEPAILAVFGEARWFEL